MDMIDKNNKMRLTTHNVRLTKWGNSRGIRVPKDVMTLANLSDNQELKIMVSGNDIVLSPVKKEPNSAKELFADWKDDGIRDPELKWGPTQGNEVQW